MFGTGVAAPPSFPLEGVLSGNVWKMFRVGGCLAHLSGSPLLQIFGSVRKMFGKCLGNVRNCCGRSPNLPTLCRPHQFRTFSEHFPNISEPFGGGRPPRGERHPTILNMFQHFPNIVAGITNQGRGGVEVMERPRLPTRPHPGGISNMFPQRGHPQAAATDPPNRSLPRSSPVG